MRAERLIVANFVPRSPFKSFPESYTLFSAICWGVRVLYGEEALKDMLGRFLKEPPFLISSPVFERGGTYFFPKPVLEDGWEDELGKDDYGKKKEVKKARYISEEAFKKVLEGEINTNKELYRFLRSREILFESVNTTHASISRITWTTAGGQLYNEEVYYISAPFLVFFLFFDGSFETPVRASLEFSQLGGNRSTGMGYYHIKFGESPRWIEKHLDYSDRFISLSPHFYDESFDMQKSMYDVFPTMGVVDNYFYAPTPHILKKRVMYINKGSNMKLKEKKHYYGKLKEVLVDNHRNVTIYQYGYAFPLYVRC